MRPIWVLLVASLLTLINIGDSESRKRCEDGRLSLIIGRASMLLNLMTDRVFDWWPIRVVSNLIGPSLYGKNEDEPVPTNINWIVSICLSSSLALMLVAIGHGAGRRGDSGASFIFWSGGMLLSLPLVTRIAWPTLSRAERVFSLVLLGEFLFIYKILRSPTSFTGFDEMLHWISAHDILYYHKLFIENPLLPISPFYPALEILTTALSNLAGLSIFPAAFLVIAVLRATFIVTLFLFFDKISGSSRLAAIATIIYMSCSTFVMFDASFAYESLGVVLGILVVMVEARIGGSSFSLRVFILPFMLLTALTMTHHVSSILCASYLVGVVAIEAIRRDKIPLHIRLGMTGAITITAIILPLLWMAVRGNPFFGYISPHIESAVNSLYEKLNGSAESRTLFVGADGKVQPFFNRFIGISSTLFLAIGLGSGFFRALTLTVPVSFSGWARIQRVISLKYNDSRVVLLALAAFGFPLTVALRLTEGGWEIGFRLNTFVFIPVGFVVAVGIAHYWMPERIQWMKMFLTSIVIADILMGAFIIGSGFRVIRGPYVVGADEDSIEAMGIDMARWTRTWLGEGNAFVTDRVNQTLLATYGQQDVISSMTVKADQSRIFFDNEITGATLYPIKKGKVDYILVDLRLSTARAAVGEYYENGESRFSHGNPPIARNLLKYDEDSKVSRVFDNGWIVIYDVKGLRNGQ